MTDAESVSGALRCDTDGCDTEIVGLEDGWEVLGSLRCADCIEYNREHGHWPDEDQKSCIKCMREANA